MCLSKSIKVYSLFETIQMSDRCVFCLFLQTAFNLKQVLHALHDAADPALDIFKSGNADADVFNCSDFLNKTKIQI